MNDNSFLIIPYSILKFKDIRISEKLVLAEVISLSKQKGYCYATNRFIANRTSLSPSRVSHIICKLQQREYLTVEIINNHRRRIFISKEKVGYNTLSICNYSDSTNGNAKYDITFASRANPLAQKTSNKRKNKRNNNNSVISDEASYDIEELMRIE